MDRIRLATTDEGPAIAGIYAFRSRPWFWRTCFRMLLASCCCLTIAAVSAQSPLPPALPGAGGPRVELVNKPPHDLEVVDVFVYATPDQAAFNAPRPNRFPSRLAKLTLDIRVKELRRLGTVIRFDVLTTSGGVEMADGFFSFSRLEREGVASMELDLLPTRGVFEDGPYQLKLFMNDILVAVLNWSVG